MKKHLIRKRLGWHPDHPDHRDLHLEPPTRKQLAQLAPVFSTRAGQPAIYNQLALGSCTANATCRVLQYREMVKSNGAARPVPSRLYQYYNSRSLMGTVGQDSGATLRLALKAAAGWGFCAEDMCPYDITSFTVKPSAAAYAEGRKHKLSMFQYARVQQDSRHLKNVLALGMPVVFGFTVYESFEQVGSDGVVPIPTQQESVLGGHAVCIVGYDDTKLGGCFEVANSWGAGWGDSGYCWMPYGYVLNPQLAQDFWTVQDVATPDAES